MQPARDRSQEICRLLGTHNLEAFERAVRMIAANNSIAPAVGDALVTAWVREPTRLVVPGMYDVVRSAPEVLAQSFVNCAARLLRTDPPDTAMATRCFTVSAQACAWGVELSDEHRRVIREEIAPLVEELDGNRDNAHRILMHIQPSK